MKDKQGKEYQRTKRARTDHVSSDAKAPSKENLSMVASFRVSGFVVSSMVCEASFAEKCQAKAMANRRGDTNLLPFKVFDDVMRSVTDVSVALLEPAHVLESFSGEICASCTRRIKLSVH